MRKRDIVAQQAGQFIVLDGPDGCGKSTQAHLLAEWLAAKGLSVSRYRDPGTTEIGEKVRAILLDAAHTAMTAQTEMLLYMAARTQLWFERIQNDLSAGRIVLLDRWLSSTCAYQGVAGGVGIETVIAVARQVLPRVWPDITILLDISYPQAQQRLNRPLDRMEQKGAAFHQRVREGFWALNGVCPQLAVVDAAPSVERVQQSIRAILCERFQWPVD